MKKKLKGYCRTLILLTLVVTAFLNLTAPAKAIQVSSVSLNVVTKSVNSGGSISFSASDFADMASDASVIRLASLPEKSLGVLMLGNRQLEVGSTLTLSELDDLVFRAGHESGIAAMFEVAAISGDGSEKNVAVVVRVNSGPNYAPVAQSIYLKTYKGVSVEGRFSASDPEGDTLSYEIALAPHKGSVTVNGDSFVYTPKEGLKGRDVFTYYSIDSNGNISEQASVHINILKQKSSVAYSDLKGNGAAYAAIRLAESGVFVGEKLGSSYFFSPDKTVTRGEFLALCMRACGVETIKDISKTGFDDDASIETWLKPYVSAAVLSDIIGGYRNDDGAIVFSADKPVTFAEAAVIMNRALKITDVEDAVCVYSPSAPAWAYQATMNLASQGMLPSNPELLAGGYLTRADTAKLLCSAMDIAEQRGDRSLLDWARR